MRVPTGDKNVNMGLVHPDGLPPPPPIPPACRGVGNLHQALQGMNFGDMTPLFHAIVREVQGKRWLIVGRELLSQDYGGGKARGFEIGASGQSTDVVILVVVLVYWDEHWGAIV
ncbi:hypothetical protein V6N13_073177 [Hibiscus sabdariffa]